jgi:hypothetical protein
MFDFAKTMKEKSDAELLSIVGEDSGQYQQDAISAAQVELNLRNLSDSQITQFKKENKEKKDIELQKAQMPLDTHYRVLTLIFPAIITIVLSGYFKGSGYDRKAKELVLWTFYGFGFYFLLIFILKNL